MSFAKLKENRSKNIENLIGELEKTKQQNFSNGDDRIWKPERDKSGNGYAIIRFLPPVDGEDMPWVRLFSHGFQGPGGWYIENSLTTLNQKDPVSEYNTSLWNNGTDEGKEVARKQKRRLNYYSNIYVVKDPANPSNEGEVFLYKYGEKIFDKVNDSLNPEFQDETPVNPFDLWEGADFKLKIRTLDGFVNYDRSEFDSPTPLLGGDDEKLEELWNKQYKLQELVAPDQFKSYDELKTKLDRILGKVEQIQEPSAPSVFESTAKSDVVISTSSEADEDDDAMSYFAKLAEES